MKDGFLDYKRMLDIAVNSCPYPGRPSEAPEERVLRPHAI